MIGKASTQLEQLFTFTQVSIRARFRGTLAGFIWVVINPLILFFAQAFIFKRVLNISLEHYELFLLSGLLPWHFIGQSFEMGTNTLQQSSALLKSYSLNPFILIGAQLLDNFITFLAGFLLLLVPYALWSGQMTIGFLFIPFALINMVIGLFAFLLPSNLLHVFYKDTKFLIQFAMSIFFFLTPIFYPIDIIPPSLTIFIEFNPFYRLIEPFRICCYHFDLQLFAISMAKSLAFSLFFFIIAISYWRKKQNELYLCI